jgi:hypothetical protein
MLIALCSCLVACSSNDQSISQGDLPAGVRAAFIAEHPYATIDHAKVENNPGGQPEDYVIPYTRPDGTSGKATYTPAGSILEDK